MRYIVVLAVFAISLIILTASFYSRPVEAIILPHMNPDPMVLSMDTKNGSTVQASNRALTLSFTICRDIGASFSDVLSPADGWFHYSIDNQVNMNATPITISRSVTTVTSHHGGPTQHETTHYSITVNLNNQTEGMHNITSNISFTILPQIFGNLLDYRAFDPVYFTITGLPSIQIESLQNTTYSSADIPLNFVTNEYVTKATYSLDGQQNVTVDGNTTISNLSNGPHNVTLFAWDIAGNSTSPKTAYFEVAADNIFTLESLQSFTCNSLATIFLVVILVVVFACALLVLVIKRRHKN